jgi:integrase
VVELPRKEFREARALSGDEVRALQQATRGTTYEALFAFLLGTGCRPSAYAMKWRDLDLDAGTARIRRAVERVRKEMGHDPKRTSVRLKETKTAKSQRTIRLGIALIETLREHRARQAVYALKEGAACNRDFDLVFATESGGILDPLNVRHRHFKPALKRAAPPDLPPVFVPSPILA